jgi:hypothetical protein
VKIAYRSKGDVDTEKGLGNILTAPSCHPVQGGKIRQHSGKSGTKTGSGMGGNVCPGGSPTRAFHTPQRVFRDQRLDLWNINDLATKVVPKDPAGLRVKRPMTGFARLRKYLFNMIHFFDGNQLSSRAFVTRLSTSLAFPRLLRAVGSRFGSGTIRRRRLGGIGRISGQKSDLTFQFSHSAFENLYGLIRLNDEINRSIGIFIHKLFGFFSCHERRPNLILIPCQENDEKKTRYRATTKNEKIPAPHISTKKGGHPVNAYKRRNCS